MEKNTLVTYGLILVSVLTIAALLLVFTPLGNATTDAIGGIVDEYVNRTQMQGGQNDRDEVNREKNDKLTQVVTLNFIYENGQAIVPTKKLECKYGEKINISALMPKPEGFKPNYTPAEQTVTRDLDYTITYYPQQYSITYNLNGGTIVSSRPNTYIYGQVTNLPTKVMKDGYTFIGWYEDKECLNKKITSIDTDRNENITLYAKWSDTKYNITYISNNEDITSTLDAAKEVVYGTTYELPVLNSTTTTYFAGWYNNPEFAGTSITHTPIHPEDNLTYYAKWTTNNAKQITYVLDGGAFVGTYPTYYTEGSPIYLSQNVKKEGYYFRGWYDNPQFDGEIINTIKATDTGDKTFYAKWTPVYYNISYDTDGGTIIGISTSSYVYGTIVKFPTNVVKDGYVFTGWKDVETKNIVTETTSTQLGHIKLEAQYTVAKYPLILDANGGLFDEDLFDDNQANYSQYTKMLQYKEIYGTLPTPYRKGYNFEKWSTSKNGVPEVSAETIYTATTESGITIYAIWTPKTYTITYYDVIDANGILLTDTFTYGSVHSLPTTMSKEHYNFGGWYAESSLTNKIDEIPIDQDSDITVYPKWIPQTFTITFRLNGGKYTGKNPLPTTYTYGTTTELPIASELSKQGYTFSGWKDTSENIYSTISETDFGDKVLDATWGKDTTTIIFTLVDSSGNPIIIDETTQKYSKLGVTVDETCNIKANEIVECLNLQNDYYHDKLNIYVDSSLIDGGYYSYNLTVMPYKKIHITSDVQNTDASFVALDKHYIFKQNEDIIIDDIITTGNNGQFVFAEKVLINGKEKACIDTNALKTLLVSQPATTATVDVSLLYNETAYQIILNTQSSFNISNIAIPSDFPQTYYSSQGCSVPSIDADCYNFIAWYAQNHGTTINVYNSIPIGTTGDVELRPVWEKADINDATHSYVITTPATCTQEGIKTCSKCDAQQEIPKVDHEWENTLNQYDGVADGFLNNIYQNDLYCSVYHYAKCINCEARNFSEHNWITYNTGDEDNQDTIYAPYSNSQHKQECKDCGYIELQEHNSTHKNHDDNTHTQYCDKCLTDITTEHEFIYQSNDDNTHTYKCIVCNYEQTSNHSFTLIDYVFDESGLCTGHIHACEVCNASYTSGWDKQETITEGDGSIAIISSCNTCSGKYNPSENGSGGGGGEETTPTESIENISDTPSAQMIEIPNDIASDDS